MRPRPSEHPAAPQRNSDHPKWRQISSRLARGFAGLAIGLLAFSPEFAAWIAGLPDSRGVFGLGVAIPLALAIFLTKPAGGSLAWRWRIVVSVAVSCLSLCAMGVSLLTSRQSPLAYTIATCAFSLCLLVAPFPRWRPIHRRLLALGGLFAWAPLAGLQTSGAIGWAGLPVVGAVTPAGCLTLSAIGLGIFFLQPPPSLLSIAFARAGVARKVRWLGVGILAAPVIVGVGTRGLLALKRLDSSTGDALHDAIMVAVMVGLAVKGAQLFHVETRAARRSAAARTAALNEAESYFEGTPSGMLVTDSKGRIERANSQACFILGAAVDSLKGSLIEEFITGLAGEIPDLALSVHFTASTGLKATRGDGTQIQVDVALNPWVNDSSSKLLISIRDLTKAYEAQRRLTERQHRLEEAQALAHTGSWDWAASGNVSYSPELLRIVGRTRDSFVRGPLLERSFFEPDSWDRLAEALQTSRASGEDFVLDLVVQRPDGTVREVVVRGGPRERDGILRLPGTLQDVTEQRRIERALTVASERLEQANDAAGVGIWDVDVLRQTVVTDAQHDRLFGLEPGTFGNSALAWRQWVHPEDLPRALDKIAAALRGEGEYEITFRICPPTGEVRYLRGKGAVRWNAEGAAVRLVGVYWDVTSEANALKAVEAALGEKDVLLREIHHRVKNNMQLVSSLLELHARRVTAPEEAAIFRDCQTRIRSMARIHERLYQAKDLAVIDFGDHLRELVRLQTQSSARGDFRSEIQLSVISLPLSIDTAIPLGLIASELIGNVWRHAFTGRAAGKLMVRLDQLGESMAMLELIDDGVGFPADFSPARTTSLGWRLVHSLCRQLRANYEIGGGPGNAFVRVSFAADFSKAHHHPLAKSGDQTI